MNLTLPKTSSFHHSADEQAATWVARQSRGLTAAESIELQHWHADARNALALQQMASLWEELNVLRILASVLPLPQRR